MYDVILASAGYDHTIKFWDANTGICRRTINYADSQVNRLTITPDRKYIGVAAHNIVKVYDVFSHESEVSYEGHTGNITSLGFQKDNKWFFTSSEDGTLKIFDFKSTGYMRNFNNNGVMVNSAVLHPNQVEIIFGDQSGRIRIWDLTTNTTREIKEADEIPVRTLAIASDASKLVAGNNVGDVYVCGSNNNGEDFVLQQEFVAHPDQYILKCQLNKDASLLATCSSDRTCKIWRLTGGEDDDDFKDEQYEPWVELAGHGGWVWDCDFTSDSVYCITVSTDTQIRIWKIEKADVRKTLLGHTKGITCLAFCEGQPKAGGSAGPK